MQKSIANRFGNVCLKTIFFQAFSTMIGTFSEENIYGGSKLLHSDAKSTFEVFPLFSPTCLPCRRLQGQRIVSHTCEKQHTKAPLSKSTNRRQTVRQPFVNYYFFWVLRLIHKEMYISALAPELLALIPQRARAQSGTWLIRLCGFLISPILLRPAALLCAAPMRTALVCLSFWIDR